MKINDFVDELFNRLAKKELEEYEVYFMSSSSSNIKVYNNQVDSYLDSTNRGVSLRVKKDGKMGYSFTESLKDEDVESLIDEALLNSVIIEKLEDEPMHDGSGEYKKIDDYKKDLENLSVEDRVELLKEIESIAKSIDPRVVRVSYCQFGLGESRRVIRNSLGLNLEDRGNSAYAYISIVAKEGDLVKTGYSFHINSDFSTYDPKKIAREAVEKVIKKLDRIEGIDVNREQVPVIIKNEAFGSMIEAFSGVFSGESVEKGLSKLKGKIGEKIANEIITLVDNPHLEKGLGSKGFDAEGYPTRYKEVISSGVLTTFLHNLKTAKQAGVESTGNAAKGGYKGNIGISPSNFYILNGDLSVEKLMEDIEVGVYIDSFSGLHSGINGISGDFSLAAEAFAIEGGKTSKALKQITVAGNYFNVLQDVKAIGNDLEFGLSPVSSPSVRIDTLSIAID